MWTPGVCACPCLRLGAAQKSADPPAKEQDAGPPALGAGVAIGVVLPRFRELAQGMLELIDQYEDNATQREQIHKNGRDLCEQISAVGYSKLTAFRYPAAEVNPVNCCAAADVNPVNCCAAADVNP
jgi:hypothetical protein